MFDMDERDIVLKLGAMLKDNRQNHHGIRSQVQASSIHLYFGTRTKQVVTGAAESA